MSVCRRLTQKRYGLSILAITAVVAFAVQHLAENEADVDLWGNVGFVTACPGSEGFLRMNTFSYTEPDHPWINHEWLAQYLFHGVYTWTGATGVLIFKIGIGLMLLAAMCLGIQAPARNGPAYFLLLLLALSTMGYGFSTRPHLFTYVLTAVSLRLLLAAQSGKRYPFLLLPLLAVPWANLHGAFFIGLVLILLFAITETLQAIRSPSVHARRAALLFATGAGFWLFSLLTPYGIRTWSFIGESAAIMRPYLSEWAPLNPITHFTDHVDFLALIVLSVVVLCVSRARLDLAHAVTLLCAAVAAFVLRRNIPLYAIAATVLLAPHIASVADPAVARILDKFPRAVSVAALAAFIGLSVTYTTAIDSTHPTRIVVPSRRFPRQIVAFMKANGIHGNALVFFDWGEYCIWHLYPQCKVFMDGRFRSAYSPTTIEDYFSFLYGKTTWRNALDHYPTDIVLVHPRNPAASLMHAQNGWVQVSHTDTADLFLKASAHADLLARWRTASPVFPTVPETGLFAERFETPP